MALQIIQTYPLGSLIVISFFITLVLTLVYKIFSDQEEIKASKDKMKDLNAKMKAEKDQEKIMAMQKELMQINMSHLKHSMKPMLITFLPLILIFWWLRLTFIPFGNLIEYNLGIPGFCFVLRGICDGAGWFLVYVFSSIIFNFSLRKAMGVH